MKTFFKSRSFFSSLVSVILSVFLVASVTFAATTISTNINTGGTLTVTGASTLTGAVTTAGAVTLGDAAADAIVITGNASTTNALTVGGVLYVSGNAVFCFYSTTTSGGNFSTLGTIVGSSTAQITGAFTTYGNVTLGDAQADTLTVNAGTLTYGSAATTTIVSSNLGSLAIATSSATVPFLRFDTSNSRIGIGTTSPGRTFSVAGSAVFSGDVTVEGTFTPTQTTATSFTVTGATLLNGAVTLGDAAADVITITGNASTTNAFTVGSNLYVGGRATTTGASGNFATEGTITLLGRLNASSTSLFTGALTTYGAVTLGDAAADVITITGNASTTNALTVGGNLYVSGRATTTASTGAFETWGNLSINGLATTTSSTGNIGTMGKIGAGTTTPTTLELSAGGSATTTIGAFSSGTRVGGCIQLTGTDGTLYRVYATTTANENASPLYYSPGSCK